MDEGIKMDFTQEEIELVLLGLDGISFTTNVNNFKQVKQKIDMIENLKGKLKKPSESPPDQKSEENSD